MKKLLTIALLVFTHTLLNAGGFQTGTQGSKAMGMGHAFVGQASDLSAIYFNAAGLTNLKGFNFMIGTTLIAPSVEFTGPKPSTKSTKTVSRIFTPINLYGSYGVTEDLVVGLGVYNPFGLGSEWPKGWVGKSLATKTQLTTFYINPTVAYKLSDMLSVGAGVDVVLSSVHFYQEADFPPIPIAPGVFLPAAPNVGINLEGSGDPAYTFNFGILFKPYDFLSLGLAYRHSAKLNFDGDLTFSNLPAKPAGYPIGHKDLFPDGKGKASLTMPYDLRFGVSVLPMNDLTVNADVQYVGWESYKELAVDFEKETAAWKDIKTEKNWKNSFTFRIGGEYRYSPFAFRLGYVYDGSPIPTSTMDPSLPGANRHEFTVGFGYQILRDLRADIAYQFISFTVDVNDSKLNFNGQYKNATNLVGVHLAYNF